MQVYFQKLTAKEVNVLLLIVVTAVYCNALFGEYVHDDISAVLQNSDVQGDTPFFHAFFNDFWGTPIKDEASHKSYRPLTILTFRLERWILGCSCALVSHVINVALHALTTLLYAHAICGWLRLTRPHALVSGIMFATHSIHVEAVTGIVGRADVLAALSFLLSFYFYDRLMVEKNKKHLIYLTMFVVSTVGGVLCKETALSVTGVCFLWEILCFVRRISRKRDENKKYIPILMRISLLTIVTSVILFLRIYVMRTTPTFSRQDNPVSFRSRLQVRALSFWFLPAFNTWLLLYPWKLSHDWQMNSIPPVENFSDPRNICTFTVCLSIICLFIKAFVNKGREYDAIIWGLGVMVISFLPASNIFFKVGFVVAERILYIPSIGFCTIFGVGFLRMAKFLEGRAERKRSKGSWPSRVAHLALLFLLIILSLRTLRRNVDWWSRDRLLLSGLRALPQNAKMHYNYANLCREEGRPEEAIISYLEALRLWPDYPSAHNNVGAAFLETNHPIEAEHHFLLALNYQPHHLHALSNLAALYKQTNRTKESISLLRDFFVRKPSLFKSVLPKRVTADIINLGLLLASLYGEEGLLALEEKMYVQMTLEFPWSANVLWSYGSFLVKQKKFKEAEKYLEAALSMDPSHARALASYATITQPGTNESEDKTLLIRALVIGWDSDTATSLGKTHLQQGRLEEAAQVLSQVLIHDPHHLGANVHLAQVRLQQRHYPVSEALLRDVLKAFPNDRQALYHLSLLFASTDRHSESIQAATKAAAGCSSPKELCAVLHAHLADILHNNAMLEPAVQNYQKALDLEPSLLKAHLNLGAIYHTQSNYSHAWEHYSEALKLEPSNAILLENIYKLKRVFKVSTEGALDHF